MDDIEVNSKAPNDNSIKQQPTKKSECPQQIDFGELRELCRPISQATDSSDSQQIDKKSYLGRMGKWLFGPDNT